MEWVVEFEGYGSFYERFKKVFVFIDTIGSMINKYKQITW